MALHLIADDLESHAWYTELARETVADAEAFAGRWAAFEEYVSALREDAADADD